MTGRQQQRKLWSGLWTFAQANPATQTTYIPVYQVQGASDHWVAQFINSMVMGTSATWRQRMANNGYAMEICGFSVTEGLFFRSLRPDPLYYTHYAGATNFIGGNLTTIEYRGVVEPFNSKSYIGAFGDVWHEMAWAEMGIFFPVGQRPAGKESITLVSDWPEVISLISDCVGNGASTSFTTDRSSFCNLMRCGQRSEAFPAFSGSIPFNATSAQVKSALEQCATIRVANNTGSTDDIVVTGGPLPTPVNISFSPGQYANVNVAPLTVKTNSLNTGSPVITTTTTGTRAISGTYGNGTTFTISAQTAVQQLTTTGSPSSGSFVLNFAGGIDRMLSTVGPGTNQGAGNTGGTPQSRVNTWLSICSNNGWIT